MKKFFSIVLFLSPFFAAAQIESYVRFTEGNPAAANINVYVKKKISSKFDLTLFALNEKNFSEALVGVSYSPSNHLSFGVSTGIESGGMHPRFAASIWTGGGHLSFLLLGELGHGEDNYWYRANAYYKFSDKFTFGATAWRFHGVGPNARFTIKKLASTLWVMPAYDFESDDAKLMMGVSVKL